MLGERGAGVVVRVLDKADLAVSGVKVMLLPTRLAWVPAREDRGCIISLSQAGVTSRLGNVRFSGYLRAHHRTHQDG